MRATVVANIFVLGLMVSLAFSAYAETDAERKKRLEEELQNVERQILKQQVLVEDKQLERQSLERDLDILDAQITKARLGIQARAVAIEQLDGQIGDKELVVRELEVRLDRQRQSLAQLLRKTQEIDDYSLMEILLGNQNLSDFFEDLESFQSIKLSLNESLRILDEIKGDTEEQIDLLAEKQVTEAQMKQLQEQEKVQIENKESEKEVILDVTKGEERLYQALLKEHQKTAAELRNALFKLSGGGEPIPFPEAVELAQNASKVTGVPATLILAILEQETYYGSNTGTCSMDDTSLGKDIMHPTRDKPVFLVLAETLGFNPATQVVSCPLKRSNGTRIGWGGAMGPSQFIPSTWAIYGGIVSTGSGYTYDASQDRIRVVLGKRSPSNPFNNQDAFTATSLLLKDNGADGSYSNDRLSALRYYAGWGGALRAENQFYGDNVMNRKSRLDTEVKILLGG